MLGLLVGITEKGVYQAGALRRAEGSGRPSPWTLSAAKGGADSAPPWGVDSIHTPRGSRIATPLERSRFKRDPLAFIARKPARARNAT